MEWLISSVTDKTSKVAEYILAAREMGISILPVDVNKSIADFGVEGKNIRFGFNAVKSMGRPTITAIIEKRKLEQFNADFEKYEAGIYMEFNNSEWKKLSIQDAYTLGSSFEDTFNAYFGK